MKFQLDYQIHEYLDNHPGNNGCYKYDLIHWEVQVHNEELLNDINNTFGCKLILNDINIVTEHFARMIKEYCWARKNKYSGTYGTKYKNDLIKQLFDKKD